MGAAFYFCAAFGQMANCLYLCTPFEKTVFGLSPW